jgi:hypothetical protein
VNEAHWKWLRELFQGSDLDRAHRVEDDALAKATESLVPPELRRELSTLKQTPDQAIRLGRFSEGPLRDDDLLVGARDLLAHHHVLGASGAGKTYYVVHEILAPATEGHELPHHPRHEG